MGVGEFSEDSEAMKARRTFRPNDIYEYSTDALYSFSLQNSNLDLWDWKIVDVPGAGTLDLTDYWRDMPMRIVAYEVWRL